MMILYDSPIYKIVLDDPDSNTESGSDLTETTNSTSVSADSDFLASVNRTNDLLTGIIFFMGLIFGLLGMTIFWNSFKGN